MSRPAKRAIAVVIQKGDRILSVRRADDDDEFPGVWGIPAASFRELETPEDVIRRIGREKLGMELHPLRKLAQGTQDRLNYRLEMELWDVTTDGEPRHANWEWANYDLLEDGREKGSLCCDLALKVRRAGQP